MSALTAGSPLAASALPPFEDAEMAAVARLERRVCPFRWDFYTIPKAEPMKGVIPARGEVG
jgi:hypothetical protein